MILAHHAGEELIPSILGGAAALPVLLVVARSRLRRVGRLLLRRPPR